MFDVFSILKENSDMSPSVSFKTCSKLRTVFIARATRKRNRSKKKVGIRSLTVADVPQHSFNREFMHPSAALWSTLQKAWAPHLCSLPLRFDSNIRGFSGLLRALARRQLYTNRLLSRCPRLFHYPCSIVHMSAQR